jgi:hypothetical protein
MSAPHLDDLQGRSVSGVIDGVDLSSADLTHVIHPVVQHVLSRMLTQNAQQADDILSLKAGQEKKLQLLAKLVGKRSIKAKPSSIVVAQRLSSSSGGASAVHLSSDRSVRAVSSDSSAQDEDGLMLECMFCRSVHHNEKSHWQHFDRLGKRVGLMYSGDCIIPPQHPVLNSYQGADFEKMHCCIKQYNSHISSSKEKGIYRARAAKLRAFVDSKSQQYMCECHRR